MADALRPELENTRNDIRNIIVPRDAERRDMHSHAERGNEVKDGYIATIHAGSSGDYGPMTWIFSQVLAFSLKQVSENDD